MTGLEIVLLCLAGGVGAALRFVLDGTVRHHSSGSFPLGTMIINVSGSFILGLITGLVAGSVLTHGWQLVLGTGLMGGYTTFSTASLETVRLLEDRRWLAAAANGLGMLVIAVAAAAGGYALGLWL
ncbi:fluoride efflux transporter CrcB [Microlunatus ginsengisoli]|uniref:Fluoride-specific ion channel FluC n=1 Tax=Microlunatus ginsengisoli TaxID=363863 RepID=A0ABP6ZG39_9ACTN